MCSTSLDIEMTGSNHTHYKMFEFSYSTVNISDILNNQLSILAYQRTVWYINNSFIIFFTHHTGHRYPRFLCVAPWPQEHDGPYRVLSTETRPPSLNLLGDPETPVPVRCSDWDHGGLVCLLQPLPDGPLGFMRKRGITRRVERLHALWESTSWQSWEY